MYLLCQRSGKKFGSGCSSPRQETSETKEDIMVAWKHIARRFVIHYFSAFGVWMLVHRFATEPLMGASESTIAKVLTTAFIIGFVAINEIFDASKAANIRGDVIALILKTGATPPQDELRAVLTDPRFTLKKSMYDILGWGAGSATVWVLL